MLFAFGFRRYYAGNLYWARRLAEERNRRVGLEYESRALAALSDATGFRDAR
jgi:hypothetical protein